MTPTRYSRTAMALHWLIAGALLFQMGLGEAFEHLPKGKALFDLAQFHKSIGITIMLLSLARLAVRFAKPRPAPLPDKDWAQKLASLTHWGLYAFMILTPLTGWIMISAAESSIPTYLFSAVPWPNFPIVGVLAEPTQQDVHEFFEAAHGLIANLGLLLFFMHVAGALRHQWLLKEPLIERMIPVPGRLSRIGGSALIVALAAAAMGFLALGKMPGIAPAARVALTGEATPVVETNQAAPLAPPSAVTPEDRAALDEGEGDEPVESEAKPEDKPAQKGAETVATAPFVDAIPTGTTPTWTVAPGGRLGFTAAWSGTPINGRFASWSSDIRFNSDALEASKISVTIDLGSVGSGDGDRDTMLKSGDFFNVPVHPKAEWTSGKITSLGGDRYRADGTLTMHGVNKTMPLTFTLVMKGKEAQASGSASLNRTDFGVGQGDYVKTDEIADAVKISFSFKAKRP